ncbi:MAG: DUF896 domain-containing protein [Clostridiales bacterium]|nr:DUF896 domain-containing protein [Clostridiales bacterium]
MDAQSIDRINQLSRLSRERPLTDGEAAEREALRKAYLLAFRESTRRQLDNTYIQYPDGTKVKLGERKP